jgi:AraC-like DNA-binding protein
MATSYDFDTLRPQDRHAYWMDAICAIFMPVRSEADSRVDFQAYLRSQDLGVLTVTDVYSSPQRIHRDLDCIARSADEYLSVALTHNGTPHLSQSHRETRMAQGDFALYESRQAMRWIFPDNVHLTVLQIPMSALRGRIDSVESLTAVGLSRKDPVARLAFDFLAGLIELDDNIDIEIRSRLANQGLDLLSMALAERCKGMVLPSLPRSSLLYRIKRYVLANLADSEMSLTRVACCFGVTPRYINDLFQDEQTSFGRFLLGSRLELCANQLASSAQQAVPISTLAYRSGFSDMAHFSRVFKARFGTTARDYRHTALGTGPSTAQH